MPTSLTRAALLALIVWGVVILSGFTYASVYGRRAGEASQNQVWPRGTALTLGENTTVVMFVEADCPCSAASLHELNLILQDSRTLTRSVVVFEPTPGTQQVNAQSALYRRAIEMKVDVYQDLDGAERRSFDARTSGTTLVYGADGQLRFNGGITASRGHEGANAGGQAVAALVRKSGPPPVSAMLTSTPVYGCHFDVESN